MNKAEFVEAVAARLAGDKKAAVAAVDGVIQTIYANVAKGERVAITGFGVFEKRVRAARTARNPATGAAVKVKKTSVPAFRAGAEFKAIASGAKKIAAPAKVAKAPAKTVAKAAVTKAPAKTAAKTAAKAPAKAAVKAAVTKAPAKTAAKAAPVKKAVAKAPAKKAPAKTAAKAPAKKAPAKKTAR